MSPRAKAQPVEAIEAWVCSTCGNQEPGRSRPEMVEHLRGFHGIAPPVRGARNLVMHLDEGRVFHSTYEWTFQASPLSAVKALQYQSGPRRTR